MFKKKRLDAVAKGLEGEVAEAMAAVEEDGEDSSLLKW